MQIDLLAPAAFEGGQPHEQYRWLRENDPVHWHAEPNGPGFFALTRCEDVRRVSRDHATFSSEPTAMITDPGDQMPMLGDAKMMLFSDPPHHTKLRRLVSKEFTPKAARALVPRVKELARQIVDAVIERGECDFVSDVAGELPSYVIAELMGLPLDDGRMLYQLTETLHAAPESQPEGAQMGAAANMFAYSARLLAEKRKNPGDDLASKLIASEIDGQRLGDLDFHLFFMLLIDAGGDTTRNLVAGGMHELLRHPEQLARLREDLPGRLPSAREELLRWVSPVVHMRRTATRDTEIAGTPVKEGQKVVLFYGAANRDPAEFERPEELDVLRTPNHHVAFGATGAHYCLGSQLARVEIDAMLHEVLTRMQGLELAGEVEWLPSSFISGPKHMPVRFTP